jgi:Ca2+-binding EF-hand superfamily protein
MRKAVLVTAMVASAANAQVTPRTPINVVGHAWAPFISPMGEPFRPRNAADDTLARWFSQADRNHDEQISPDEMKADADRFFTELDADRDGQIEPDELIQYEWELAPDIQLDSKLKRRPGEAEPAKPAPNPEQNTSQHGRRQRAREPDFLSGSLQGAARYGLLNIPEPVAAADADFNRAVTRAEFEQAALERFQLLDHDKQGSLTLDALETMWTSVLARVKDKKRHNEETDSRIGSPLPPGR